MNNKEPVSKKNLFINIVISLLLLSKSSFSYSLTQFQSLDSLKDTIVALNVTQNKSEQELNKLYQLQKQSSSTSDIYEYSVFIEYLAYQINTYCLQIKEQYGTQALSGLPCHIKNNFQNKSSKEQKFRTSEEQLSSMENELMNSLGDFDEMLLKEEEILAQMSKKNASSSSSDSSHNGSEGSEKSDSDDGGKGNYDKKAQEGKEGSKNKSEAKKGTYSKVKGKHKNSSSKGSSERRRLDEIDDDIVARQLKEAAEKETDPRLKEKLWDEYYKYKKGN